MPRKRRGPLRTVEWLPRAQAAARRMCRVHANGRLTDTRTAAPCAADALFSGLEGYRAEGAEPVEESQRSMPSLPCAACALLSGTDHAACAVRICGCVPRCDCTRWRRFQRQRCARRASTDATVTVRLARGAAGPQVRRYRCCAPAAPRLAAGARTSETPNGEAAR